MSPHRPGRLRIVAGARRGRFIKAPPGLDTRPTSEKVRGAVFNALGPIDNLRALDLFAGSGAMGLEALSRGARECVFVEEDPRVCAVLRENIAVLGYEQDCRVVNSGYVQALKSLTHIGPVFDLLFLDPPYRMLSEVEGLVAPLLPSLLADDGVVVIEGGRATEIALSEDAVFDRIYGDTRVVMVKMRRNAS